MGDRRNDRPVQPWSVCRAGRRQLAGPVPIACAACSYPGHDRWNATDYRAARRVKAPTPGCRRLN